MRIRRLAALTAALTACVTSRPTALAAQIGTYTFTWTGTAAFGGTALIDRAFTLTTSGDVANVTRDPSTSYLGNLSASLAIGGVGTFAVTSPLYVFNTDVGLGYGVAGFGDGSDLLQVWNAALQGYDLTTSIGPVSAAAQCPAPAVAPCIGGNLFDAYDLATSGGTLVFRRIADASFSASFPRVPSTSTPEPATIALTLGGLAVLVPLARRARRERAA